jgi:Protein NO VEIN, C-terminal
VTDDVRGSTWSDGEIDLIVADYFSMLEDELASRPYVKLRHNEALQALTGRQPGSIERKHQNISAVLVRLGMRWIKGYKPLANFQNALVEGIGRYLAVKGQPVVPLAEGAKPLIVAEGTSLWVGPPPAPSAEDLVETPALARLVRKFDPAARDARNRALGKQGEELVFAHERQRLISAAREDLARRVEWTSEVRGDGAGYDIRSFEPDGRERLIEVKTTNGAPLTPFFLSENERAFSDERPDAFALLRLYRFADAPAAFELRPPLGEKLKLDPTNYRATL